VAHRSAADSRGESYILQALSHAHRLRGQFGEARHCDPRRRWVRCARRWCCSASSTCRAGASRRCTLSTRHGPCRRGHLRILVGGSAVARAAVRRSAAARPPDHEGLSQDSDLRRRKAAAVATIRTAASAS
jgi:hypothetical protein